MTTKFSEPAMQLPPEQFYPVESHLAYWLHYLGYRLFHELRIRAQQFGVTAAESLVLRKLHQYENDAMPSRLAQSLGLSRGYISRLAVRLEAKGLINRDKSASDRRTLVLTLTDSARALVSTLAELADQINGRHFVRAGEAAHQTIERVMKWAVHRNRFRFVPPERCRMRKYRYLHLGIDWDVDEDIDGNGDGFSSA
jgi:DNA-binding MarR family transcriptional regulator